MIKLKKGKIINLLDKFDYYMMKGEINDMLRLNKFTKITSIYIITMMMITTIFTYFGYRSHIKQQ